VEKRSEIVAAARVAEFVDEDGLELRGRERIDNAGGQKQSGAEESDDSRFEESGRGTDFDGERDVYGAGDTENATQSEPGAQAQEGDGQEAAEPEGK
jgi:hypothetical protein